MIDDKMAGSTNGICKPKDAAKRMSNPRNEGMGLPRAGMRAGETSAPATAMQIKTNRIMGSSPTNWIVNCHEFRAIGKSCLYLQLTDHFGDPLHHLISGQDLAAFGHESATDAAACSLHEEVCYKRDSFGNS
jgi:hypothetical protein